MLHIIVCIKQVIDPEAPSASFTVDSEAKRVVPPRGTQPVLSPFDQNALEAALKLKEQAGAEITVVSMGPKLAKPVLREALAAGADRLILLEDASFDGLTGYATACTLATAIRKIGAFDLILCGRMAADTNAGYVGSGIAESLGIPSVTVARRIEVEAGERLRIERVVPDGYDVLKVSMPVLVTAGSDVGALREASVEAFMTAAKKPVAIWNAQELAVTPSQLRRLDLVKLEAPPLREGECTFIKGATPEECGANLALKLRETKIL